MQWLSVRRLVASGIVAGALLAGVTSGPGLAPAKATLKHAVATPTGNWAGYVSTNPGVTYVEGSWVVPDAGSLPPGASANWVGIGGYSAQDLIQTGTQQVSSPIDNFVAGGAYSAWYELLPAGPVDLPGTVNPGDLMVASIASVGGNSSWRISITDVGNWSYSTVVSYVSSESSAEWVFEAPSAFGLVPVPVGGVGQTLFDGGDFVAYGGPWQTPGDAGAIPVTAVPVETTPSALDGLGDGFYVCAYALSCSPPANS
ncbi:MAG TPA: G1 family glutamic endopeptidase [Acidimicrobiales bacterium]|nr:G1 family glutamic endopeptidase [Acidimicrobiales bacterium]